MDLSRAFLFASGLLWLPYGVFCLAQPDFLREAAGVAGQTPTGTTELRAMYGGLQAAIGLLSFAGAFRRDLQRTALVALAFLAGGLLSARVIGVLVDGGVSGYTVGALAIESTLTLLSIRLLRRAA